MSSSTPHRLAYFISHATADKQLAGFFMDLMEKMTSGMTDGFRSTRPEDIPANSNWHKVMHAALNRSILTIVLLTPNSSKRQWLLYEYGYASSREVSDKSRKTKVVPILIGMDKSKLEGPFPHAQIREIKIRDDLFAIMTELAIVLKCKCDQIQELSVKFFPKIVGVTENLTQPVDPDKYGITGIFPGVIKADLSVLRSLKSAKNRIVIAGPSLATPLEDNNPRSLRSSIKCAISSGVNVYIFLANPVMRFSKIEATTISKIKTNFPGSNSERSLNELRKIYKEIKLNPIAPKGKLHVILVNKVGLDFAVICDESIVLCRSTIHSPPNKIDQDSQDRHKEHDYKPPIIEAKPTTALKDSFFVEYKNYLENLMFAAKFPAATPDNPTVVKRLFKVMNVSAALQI